MINLRHLLPLLKILILLVSVTGSYIFPDLREVEFKGNNEAMVAQYHSYDGAYFYGGLTNHVVKKEFSTKINFVFHLDEVKLAARSTSPYVFPLRDLASSFFFNLTINPRAPPIA